MRRLRRPYRGWLIVVAALAVTACLGEVLWSFGVFFKALEAEFGWSRGLTSSGYTFLAVGYGISSIAFGRLADKYPPRSILLVTALVSGTSIALCSRIEVLAQLQLLLLATGLGAGSLIPVPTATVARWFENRRGGGIALGMTMAGVGLGAMVFAPLFSRLIMALGWRTSFLVAGVLFFSIVTLSALVMRPSGSVLVRAPADSSSRPPEVAFLSRRQLLRAPQFMQVVAIMVVTTFSFQVLTVHLVPFAVDSGISQTVAAAALGFTGGFSIPGRVSSGVLSERLGWGKVLVLSQVGMATAILVLPWVGSEPVLFAIVGLYGFCHGIRAVSVIGVLGRVFGMRSVGELTGIMIAVAHTVGASGPYVAGYLFDRWGNYSITFIPLGIVMMAGAILSLKLDVDSRPGTGVKPHIR